MRGKEHVLEPISAKDDFLASGKSVDPVENLIPGVLRHQADKRVHADDGLFIEMIEDSGRENIPLGSLPF